MTAPEPTQPLTDEQLEDIRDWHNKTRDRRVGALLTTLDHLRTWNGLMELMDEKWPEDIFPTREDDTARDPGPRILSLLRWNIRLRRELAEVKAERDDLAAQHHVGDSNKMIQADEASRLRAENTAMAAKLDVIVSFVNEPTTPEQAAGMLTARRLVNDLMGIKAQANQWEQMTHPALDQSGEGQA